MHGRGNRNNFGETAFFAIDQQIFYRDSVSFIRLLKCSPKYPNHLVFKKRVFHKHGILEDNIFLGHVSFKTIIISTMRCSILQPHPEIHPSNPIPLIAPWFILAGKEDAFFDLVSQKTMSLKRPRSSAERR